LCYSRKQMSGRLTRLFNKLNKDEVQDKKTDV
jgi:hypothetical protein